MRPIQVFISYSRGCTRHSDWVRQLATRLRTQDGMDVTLDQWHSVPGDQLPAFMERAVRRSDYVLVICTPTYLKSDARNAEPSGVGYEGDIMTGEIFVRGNQRKFIPVLREGEWNESAPAWLAGKSYVDLRGDPYSESSYELLVRTLKGPTGAPPIGQTVHNLPYLRNHEFVGREQELSRLHELMAVGGRESSRVATVPKPACVTGLGGMGKTQLVLEYSYRHLDDYDSILWVDAEGEDLTAAVASLLPKLGVPVSERLTPSQQAELVRERLEQAGRHLLVLDNVTHLESYSDHLPRTGRASVVMTTRRRDLPYATELHVAQLPPADGLALLFGNSESWQADRSTGLSLCEQFGFLPLAVAVAGRVLRKGVWTPADLLATLQEKGSLAWAENQGSDPVFHKSSSLARLFDTSLELLDRVDEPFRTHARSMALVGGWFAPASIDRDVLFDATRARTGQRGDDIALRSLELLHDIALVSLDTEGRAVFHPLMQAYLRAQGGVRERTAMLDALSRLAQAVPPDTGELQRVAPHRAHMEAAVAYLDATSPDRHIWIPLQLCQYLLLVSESTASLRICRVFLDAFPVDSEWSTVWSGVAGRCLHAQARYDEALDYHLRSLDAAAGLRTTVRPRTAIALNNLGRTCVALGRYQEALDHYLQSLEIMESQLGDDHPDTGRTLLGLARSLGELGRNEEALGYYQRALDICVKRLGPGHKDTAGALHEIGRTFHRLGRYEEALANYRTALEWKENLVAAEHPDTAATLYEIALTLEQLDQLQSAVLHLERALAIEKTTLTPGHPGLAMTRFHLGRLRSKRGELDGKEWMEAAMAQLRRVLGDDHPVVLEFQAAADGHVER